MNLKVGQILKWKTGRGSQKVLAVLEDCVLLSQAIDHKRSGNWVTFLEIESAYELPKEKWKPSVGERFWFIQLTFDLQILDDVYTRPMAISPKWIYKTYEEAEAALEKIKKILAE